METVMTYVQALDGLVGLDLKLPEKEARDCRKGRREILGLTRCSK